MRSMKALLYCPWPDRFWLKLPVCVCEELDPVVLRASRVPVPLMLLRAKSARARFRGYYVMCICVGIMI